MKVPYSVILFPQAQKSLDRIPDGLLGAIELAIDELGLFRQSATQTKKLRGVENLYRKRVGDYRIVFEIRHDLQQIDILVIAKRDDVYRK